ncbi:MAG TPA: sigma-70 family RNA polymerase sigma factor [Blastocatellia bacterium]|nr:sigma-70 family RNA polymerase sigma factor [Blastocatellia bacterium]
MTLSKRVEAFTVEDFESAAMPHMNDLFRTASRVCGNTAEAEDVVQETYLQAWKSFHRFEPGTNCRAWLYKILFHVIQHRRRKWFQLRSASESDEMLLDTLVYEPPVPDHLTDEDILAAFDRLPASYREAVLLADVQEFSYKEIAEILGIPIGTVMSRINRGRKLLRAELSSFIELQRSPRARHAQQAIRMR